MAGKSGRRNRENREKRLENWELEEGKKTVCGQAGELRRGCDGRMLVDVIIPVYRPGKRFFCLLERLREQTYPVNRIIVVNTEERYWDSRACEGIDNLEVYHVTRQEFDHGNTRNLGAGISEAEVMIFMTDDAVPRGQRLVERLVEALSWQGPKGERVAAAYARQLPDRDCRPVERCTREFNYPKDSRVKTLADLPELGIKTYFASNVCCAYRRDIFERQGGFIKRTIFNEDMIYAAGVVQAGYGIAYVADARVIHSHNLTARQQFHRNFDLGVSQADHPEVFAGVASEGEGLRLVKETVKRLIRRGKASYLLFLVWETAWKYAGYRLGKAYRKLPKVLVSWCSMNPQYWRSPVNAPESGDLQEYFEWEEMAGRQQKEEGGMDDDHDVAYCADSGFSGNIYADDAQDP